MRHAPPGYLEEGAFLAAFPVEDGHHRVPAPMSNTAPSVRAQGRGAASVVLSASSERMDEGAAR